LHGQARRNEEEALRQVSNLSIFPPSPHRPTSYQIVLEADHRPFSIVVAFCRGKPFALAGSFSAVGAPNKNGTANDDDDSDDDDENTAPTPVIKRTAATRMMEF
jgi:hypothetical protein